MAVGTSTGILSTRVRNEVRVGLKNDDRVLQKRKNNLPFSLEPSLLVLLLQRNEFVLRLKRRKWKWLLRSGRSSPSGISICVSLSMWRLWMLCCLCVWRMMIIFSLGMWEISLPWLKNCMLEVIYQLLSKDGENEDWNSWVDLTKSWNPWFRLWLSIFLIHCIQTH